MHRSRRLTAAAGAALVAVGLLTAALPTQFLEERFGVAPDAGSGALELALALAPSAAGVALLGRAGAAARVGRWVARAARGPGRA